MHFFQNIQEVEKPDVEQNVQRTVIGQANDEGVETNIQRREIPGNQDILEDIMVIEADPGQSENEPTRHVPREEPERRGKPEPKDRIPDKVG